jgi:tetratricopeptide (TPR) repeat protein
VGTARRRRVRKSDEPRPEPPKRERSSRDPKATEAVGWSSHRAWVWLAVVAFGVALGLLAAELRGLVGTWLYTSAAAAAALVAMLFGLRGHLRDVPGRSFALLLLVGLAVAATLFAALSAVYEPAYPRMSGQFNVAVADFTGSDANGSAGGDAGRLADEVAQELEGELQLTAGGARVSIGVASPADVPPVTGTTEAEMAESAARAADRVGAQVVLYGTLSFDGVRTVVEPGLFVAAGPHLPGASELEGRHTLGELIEAAGDIRDLASFARVRTDLATRVGILAEFIAGLAEYQTQDTDSFETARDRFAVAVETGMLGDGRGSEVAHLFLGNAELQLGDFDAAESAYADAREVNPDSGRAALGLASTQYARAAGDDCLDADFPGLHDALLHFGAAEEARDQPPSALVVQKARLGMGRTHNCLAVAGDDDHREPAIETLRSVVESYGPPEGESDLQLRELAAIAAAELAVVYRSRPDSSALSQAAESYERAAELTLFEERRARWLGDLADTYSLAGRCVDASRAYEQAVAIEPALAERLRDVRQRCPRP